MMKHWNWKRAMTFLVPAVALGLLLLGPTTVVKGGKPPSPPPPGTIYYGAWVYPPGATHSVYDVYSMDAAGGNKKFLFEQQYDGAMPSNGVYGSDNHRLWLTSLDVTEENGATHREIFAFRVGSGGLITYVQLTNVGFRNDPAQSEYIYVNPWAPSAGSEWANNALDPFVSFAGNHFVWDDNLSDWQIVGTSLFRLNFSGSAIDVAMDVDVDPKLDASWLETIATTQPAEGVYEDHQWSQDGNTVAYRFNNRIYVQAVPTPSVPDPIPMLLVDSYRPWFRWSPVLDDNRIAYSAGSSTYIVTADGTSTQLAISGGVNYSSVGPVWSPDATQFAFHHVTYAQFQYNYAIYRATTSGQSQVKLTADIDKTLRNKRLIAWRLP